MASPPCGQVVHVNAIGFLASVEQVLDRMLQSRPFVVAHAGIKRGVILDVSTTAHQEGIRVGMSLHHASRLVPNVKVVAPSYKKYQEAEGLISGVLRKFTPQVEAIPRGHGYADLSGTTLLNGSAIDCAVRLKRLIHNQVPIDTTLCLASSKLLAKIGTRVLGPSGFLAISREQELQFLKHQSIALLPGVGQKLQNRLEAVGILEIGALADLNNVEAMALLGPSGIALRDRARGIDNEPLLTDPGQNKVLSAVHSFPEDTINPLQIQATILQLSADLGFRLRSRNLATGCIEVHIEYSDNYRTQARARAVVPWVFDSELFRTATELASRAHHRRTRIRSIEIRYESFSYARQQLDLFVPPALVKEQSLQKSIDAVRKRYGNAAVLPGTAIVRTVQSTGVGRELDQEFNQAAENARESLALSASAWWW